MNTKTPQNTLLLSVLAMSIMAITLGAEQTLLAQVSSSDGSSSSEGRVLYRDGRPVSTVTQSASSSSASSLEDNVEDDIFDPFSDPELEDDVFDPFAEESVSSAAASVSSVVELESSSSASSLSSEELRPAAQEQPASGGLALGLIIGGVVLILAVGVGTLLFLRRSSVTPADVEAPPPPTEPEQAPGVLSESQRLQQVTDGSHAKEGGEEEDDSAEKESEKQPAAENADTPSEPENEEPVEQETPEPEIKKPNVDAPGADVIEDSSTDAPKKPDTPQES